MLRGSKKTSLLLFGGPSRVKFLLTDVLIQALVEYNLQAGNVALAWMILLAWEFCLRTQSEALKLHRGTPADANGLPSSRDSGIYYHDSQLVLVLRRRKHRPHGSRLVRSCRCHEPRIKHCLVCAARAYVTGSVAGALLWEFKSSPTLQLLRTQIGLLGSADGQRSLTWKSWRAGKATQLAKDGRSIGQILLAGEWKSASFDRYVDTDLIDPSALLQVTLDQSDDEEE